MDPAFTGLLQRDLHDFRGDRGDLDIHLQRGDAGIGTRHLEIHVAKVILITQNVRQDREIIAFLDQSHGNAGNRPRHWHTCIHQCE